MPRGEVTRPQETWDTWIDPRPNERDRQLSSAGRRKISIRAIAVRGIIGQVDPARRIIGIFDGSKTLNEV